MKIFSPNQTFRVNYKIFLINFVPLFNYKIRYIFIKGRKFLKQKNGKLMHERSKTTMVEKTFRKSSNFKASFKFNEIGSR